MDQRAFDRLARVLGATGSRRAALATLLGSALGGSLTAAAAKKHAHRGKGRERRIDKGRVHAQANCANPGPGQNLDGCFFFRQNLAGVDLHGSSLRGTNFAEANLAGADLHGSNARGAIFFKANLCGAKLHSSVLRNANFSGANLTDTDLHSSSCAGADFYGAVICRTIRCNGTIDNPNCTSCCGCDSDECCVEGTCQAGSTWSQCGGDGATCDACAVGEVCAAASHSCQACTESAAKSVCEAGGPSGPAGCAGNCICVKKKSGGGFCAGGLACFGQFSCNVDADCDAVFGPGSACLEAASCCPSGTYCAAPCTG